VIFVFHLLPSNRQVTRNKFPVLSVFRIKDENIRQSGNPYHVLKTDELHLIWNNRKQKKMKRMILFTILLMALTACAAPQTQTAPELAATDMPQAGIPNPASVYCTQNGNKLEIHADADGSQNGICIFPDGGACDEWAYYRGECGPTGSSSGTEEQASGGYMPPGTTEEIADWWGVIKSTEPGAQYDDYFERQDFGQIIYFGIDSMDPAVKSQIEALRDSGKIVHLYGTLLSNVPDYNGSQIQVDRIEVEEQDSGVTTTEEIFDWRGFIKSNPPGAQFDDYFERQDLGQIIYFGIDSMDPVSCKNLNRQKTGLKRRQTGHC
jgi:putative hemolysin